MQLSMHNSMPIIAMEHLANRSCALKLTPRAALPTSYDFNGLVVSKRMVAGKLEHVSMDPNVPHHGYAILPQHMRHASNNLA
jgi:hypothetical protein